MYIVSMFDYIYTYLSWNGSKKHVFLLYIVDMIVCGKFWVVKLGQ